MLSALITLVLFRYYLTSFFYLYFLKVKNKSKNILEIQSCFSNVDINSPFEFMHFSSDNFSYVICSASFLERVLVLLVIQLWQYIRKYQFFFSFCRSKYLLRLIYEKKNTNGLFIFGTFAFKHENFKL